MKFGQDCHTSKLTDDDVRLIRLMLQERRALMDERDDMNRRFKERKAEIAKQLRVMTNCKIAEKFDLSKTTIERIAYLDHWSHVK